MKRFRRRAGIETFSMPVRQPGRRFPRQARGKGFDVRLTVLRRNLLSQARRGNLCDRNDVETFRKVSPSALVDVETFLQFPFFLAKGFAVPLAEDFEKVSPSARRLRRGGERFRRRPDSVDRGDGETFAKGFAVG